jgi:hypothetical protein
MVIESTCTVQQKKKKKKKKHQFLHNWHGGAIHRQGVVTTKLRKPTCQSDRKWSKCAVRSARYQAVRFQIM